MPGVVGREPELKAVEAFLDGTAPALAIVGEPGIGKTTVWREAVDRARARGATVLVARPAESEARLSFGGVADLTSALPPEAFDSLPAPQRRGLDVALLRADSTGPPTRRVVATALLTLLRELATESDVVIAIDDLQWLDPPSAVALEFALRRLDDENVRVIFSLRSDATEPEGLATERIEVGPVSVAALHRILGDATGRTFARPVLIRIAEASAGNPFHAIEIARELERRGVQDSIAPLPVPDSLGALVRARVRALPAPTRDALLRVAALTRPDTALVDPTALAAAEESGLVSIDPSGRVRFTHPLFASAVYAAAATRGGERFTATLRQWSPIRSSARITSRSRATGPIRTWSPSSSRQRGMRARARHRTPPRACSSSRCASCRPEARSRSGCSSSLPSTCISRATSRGHARSLRSCSRRSRRETAARAR